MQPLLLASWMQIAIRFLLAPRFTPVCMVAPASASMHSTAPVTRGSPVDLTICRRFVTVSLLVVRQVLSLISHLMKMVQVNHNHFLGYTKDADGNLIIDPEQAEVVKRIYREYLEGYSMDRIAKGLEADSILTGAGKTKWWTSTINKILRNEKYIDEALVKRWLERITVWEDHFTVELKSELKIDIDE